MGTIEEARLAGAARFAAAIEAAHEDDSAALLGCAAEAIRFEDPLSRVNGPAGLKRVMDDTWRFLPGARFRVRSQAVAGERVYTRWSLVRERGGRERTLIEAVGESVLDERGRVLRHVDYWDSAQALYRRIPLVGWLLERLRRRVSAGWEPEPARAR
jgi:steroid Delta-isomerase